MKTENSSNGKKAPVKEAKTKSRGKGNKKGKGRNSFLSRLLRTLIMLAIIACALYLLDKFQIVEIEHMLPEFFEQTTETTVSNTANYEEYNNLKGNAAEQGGNDGYAAKTIDTPLCGGNLGGNPDHQIQSYKGFTLCYRDSYENAEWVAYTLTREELNAVTGRSDHFKADPSIKTGSAAPADYSRTGFDKGHLAPAADMEWSVESMEESFYMSNMSPQRPQFNRGMWKDLEEQVRTWAKEFGQVTVITGPVLEKSPDLYDAIGRDQEKCRIAVPEFYYKALFADDAMIAFILPNQKCDGTIWDYTVTVDELERRTGIDFFSIVADSKENLLESQINTTKWKK